MSEINSYSIPAVSTADTHSRIYSNNSAGQRSRRAAGSFEDAIANAAQRPPAGDRSMGSSHGRVFGVERGSAPGPAAAAGAPPAPSNSAPAANGPFMMPMQQSWTPPVIPATPSAYPMHPVYGVPMVSEAVLNRYIHPLQSVGAIAPGMTDAAGDVGTTVYRVAPGGMQDFVTTDGFRHRFDVEVVFPSPSTLTWQDRDARQIHPEVAEFASAALREKLASSGIEVANLEITPFRMSGGNEKRPWFLDQLILKTAGKQDLPISLNVAMRDPEYTIASIKESWNQETMTAREIAS